MNRRRRNADALLRGGLGCTEILDVRLGLLVVKPSEGRDEAPAQIGNDPAVSAAQKSNEPLKLSQRLVIGDHGKRLPNDIEAGLLAVYQRLPQIRVQTVGVL